MLPARSVEPIVRKPLPGQLSVKLARQAASSILLTYLTQASSEEVTSSSSDKQSKDARKGAIQQPSGGTHLDAEAEEVRSILVDPIK